MSIGAFSIDTNFRGMHYANVVYVYNNVITTEANNAGLAVNFFKEITFLHELGHAMGLADQGTGSTSIMQSPISLSERINNDWIYFITTDILHPAINWLFFALRTLLQTCFYHNLPN